MKKIIFISVMLCISSLFSGCEKDTDEPVDGTLSVKMRTWNNFGTLSVKSAIKSSSDTIRLQFIDVKGYKYEMKVTTDEIKQGIKESDINWTTIYESNELKDDGERDFQFTLAAGEYKGFALLQGRDFFWVGEHNGNRIEIPTSNEGSSNKVFNAFGTDGLYVLNESEEFVKVNNSEQIGASFKVDANKTTTVTIRMNFTAIDWYDNDNSGTWSEGDDAGEPILPDGISTMADFIVVYD